MKQLKIHENEQPSPFSSAPHLKSGDAKELVKYLTLLFFLYYHQFFFQILQIQSISDEVKLRAAKPIAFLIDGTNYSSFFSLFMQIFLGHKPNLDVLIGDSLCPALVAAFNNTNDELMDWLIDIFK